LAHKLKTIGSNPEFIFLLRVLLLVSSYDRQSVLAADRTKTTAPFLEITRGIAVQIAGRMLDSPPRKKNQRWHDMIKEGDRVKLKERLARSLMRSKNKSQSRLGSSTRSSGTSYGWQKRRYDPVGWS
jgi:hypothetical protein